MRATQADGIDFVPGVASGSVVIRRAGWLLVCSLWLLVVGCGSGAVKPVASARAVDSGSHFQLDFSVPQTDWHTSDSITGQATLSYLGSGGVTVSGSEFISFEFDEVGGDRRVAPVSDAVCNVRELDAGHPITSEITKSAGWLPNDPNITFLQSFFASPQIHLPAGDWTITAIASLSEGDCTELAQSVRPTITLRASVVVHVTG